MSAISLKINIVKLGSVKMMIFNGNMTVQEVIRDIREKLGDEGGSDHGLFWPDQGKWLDAKRTLDFYDLKSGDLVEYKKKHRPLRVKMMDDTVRTILIDDSLIVSELVKVVCGRVGINNPDEYSFSTEKSEEEAKAAKNNVKKKDAVPDRATDTQWLNPEKSLREQGVEESEMLLLKKKFFFSDQNVDRNDPIQLNLLYVQSQEAIVKGHHPCTMEEAAQFAALQLQVQFGNHEPDKHKQGFIDLDSFLPPEYGKKKGDIEKKVYQEHRKLQGMTELNAKFRYVQLCRSLKTYGVTFFTVKEKIPKKTKMVKILLGVTRDSVMRLDAETKEVLKVWPLTTLRRWAASPNSFTLDFGDYSDNYYSVQTNEGDAISQLIGGYIDIIIKKKKDADRLLAEEETELAITEDTVVPGQATAITMVPGKAGQSMEVNVAQPGMLQPGEGMNSMMSGNGLQGMQYYNTSNAMQHGGVQGNARFGSADMSGANGAQQALLQNINNGFAAVNAVQSDLNVATSLPPLGNDPASVQWRKQTLDINKQNVQSQVAAHLAATASVLNLTTVDPEQMDYNAISSNISTMSSNLSQLASGSKMIAALMEDQSEAEKLLEAARKLAGSTQKLLTAAQPAIMGQGNRQDLLVSAQGIGASGAQLLKHMGDTDVSAASQQELIDLAKAVAQAMTEAVQHAKTVAGATPDPKNQQEVITATKNSAASAAQLVTTTQVVAPTINSPLCQEQLIESANQVENAVGVLVNKGKVGCTDKQATNDLTNAADKVRAALQKLIDKARQGGQQDSELTDVDRQAELVFAASQSLIDSLGDSAAIVASAKNLALATTALVNALKLQAANEADPNEKNRLLAAARALADATTKMVNAAKEAARNPNDPAVQARLRAAAEALQQATRAAAGADSRRKAFKKLALAAKANAAASTQLISAAKAASPSNRNQASQMQLINSSKAVAEQTGQMVTNVRALNENPDDAVNQLKLMSSAKAMLAPGQAIVAAAKAAAPTIGDQAAQSQLMNFSKTTADSLRKLKEAVDAAEAVSGSLELDSAIETVQRAREDLKQAKVKAARGELKPTSDQTPESVQLEVAATAKTIGSSMAQLISAASQGNESYTGVAARDTALALQSLSSAVKGVAATTSDRDLQDQSLDTATDVMTRSENLINVAKEVLDNPSDPSNQQKLATAATDVNKAMARLVDTLPGQRDVTRALQNMQKELARLNQTPVKKEGETFTSAQNKLASSANAVTVAANNLVVAAKGSPKQLKDAAEALELAFSNLVGAGQQLAAQTGDVAVQAEIQSYINDVFSSVSKLLQSSKAFNADPNGANLKNLLTLAAKGVADSITKLLSLCSTAAPGQKEVNHALQTLDLALARLENVNEPNTDNEDTYFQSLKKVLDGQAALAGLFTQIPASARASDAQAVGTGISKAADAVFAMTDATVRAAYLIGVSDPSSVAAVPGLVDAPKVSQAVNDIKDACQKLGDPNNKQQQILAAASVIAKNTSALCTNCKNASAKTNNPVAKNQFIASAKTVATTTAALVTNIKALATSPSDSARAACITSSQPLIDAIDNLKTFADSPEFAASPAYISPMSQKYQTPLTKADRDLIESMKEVCGTVKTLCANCIDTDTQQLFISQAKGVSDNVRTLVNSIKNGAPGQKECDQAIDKVSASVAELDAAAVSALSGDLKPVPGPDFSGFKDSLLNNVHALMSTVDIVGKSAKQDPEALGQSVIQLSQNFAPFTKAAIGAASKTHDSNLQTSILDAAKAVADNTNDLLYASKTAGGNTEATTAAQKVDQATAKVNGALKNLLTTLEGSSDEAGQVNAVIDDLTRAMDSLNDHEDAPTDLPYQGYADQIQAFGKDLANTMQDVVSKSRNPEELPPLAAVVGEKYGRLVRSAKGAAATATEDEVKQSVLESVRALGGSNVRLLDAMKQTVSSPNDPSNRGKIANAARDVSSSIAKVVTSVKQGSKGLLMCQQAIEAISDVIAELETAIVFATAGQLDPTDKADNFNNYKETILTGTKDLTNDVKALVAGATSTQENLAAAASSSVNNITSLKDSIKSAAAAITSADRNGQEQLLIATKNVAEKLQEHITASMKASSKSQADMNNLRESAKAMVATISELLRVVKAVGDEASRAMRALDSAGAGILSAISILDSDEPAQGSALPDEIVKTAKAVAAAAASLVTASNGAQDDVITAAGNARATVEDLLRVGKAATANAPEDKRQMVHNSVKTTAQSMSKLLSAMKTAQSSPTPANKTEVQKAAKAVAETVNKVVDAAGGLIPTGYVDPNDPNVIAERELLAAASSIEAAARKLAALQPPERPREANEELPFEAQILEAAKAIAAATAALVRSATQAQREIVALGKSGPAEDQMYFSDGTWSDGLVSAAKQVAATTGDLCDSANQAVQGKADRERVIASAKGVSASTAQLLSAATVKTDKNSDSTTRLRAAGATVTRATKSLVQAAENSMAFDNSEQLAMETMKSGIGSRKAEMEAQMEILRIEKQLEDARKKLGAVRQQKYQK